MRGFLSLLGLVLVFAFATVCWAEGGVSSYEAEVGVEDQSPEQRQRAIRTALEKVLNQVSEERKAAIPKKVRNQVLRSAERYVQQYGYTEQGLWVRFDQQALDKLLLQEQDTVAAAGSGGGVLMKVSGVQTLADYVRVMEYLEAQKFARGVQPLVIEPEAVLIELAARGEPDAVFRAIGRDNFLQWMSEEAGVPSFHYSP